MRWGGRTRSGKNHDRGSLEEGAVQAGGEEDSWRGKPTERVCVEGARKVWGTMKVTTSASLKYAVSRVCNITALQIKRKTVSDHAGQVNRWWFVMHAPENQLLDLDAAGKQLQLQTGWKLEHCFKPASKHAPQGTSSSCSTPQSHATENSTAEPTVSLQPITSSANQATPHASPATSPFLGN